MKIIFLTFGLIGLLGARFAADAQGAAPAAPVAAAAPAPASAPAAAPAAAAPAAAAPAAPAPAAPAPAAPVPAAVAAPAPPAPAPAASGGSPDPAAGAVKAADQTCAQKANACYNKSIETALTNFHFDQVCSLSKTIKGCLAALTDADSSCNASVSEFKNVQIKLGVQDYGACDDDDKVVKCASDYQACLKNIQGVKTSCVYYQKLENCSQQIKDSDACKGPVNMQIDAIQKLANESNKLLGCEGDCGKAVATCAADFSRLVDEDFNLDATFTNNICDLIDAAKTCLDELVQNKKNNPCGTDSHFLDQLVSEKARFEGFCDDAGDVSTCVKQSKACSDTARSVPGSSPSITLCNSMATYKDCLAEINTCQNETVMYTRLQQWSSETVSWEGIYDCKSIQYCAQKEKGCNRELNLKVPSDDKDGWCNKLSDNIKCFDGVSSDKTCKAPGVLNRTQYDNDVRATYKQECDGAGIVQVTFVALILTVLVTMKNSFM